MPQNPNAPWSTESGAPITAARSSATRSRGSCHAPAPLRARKAASSPCQVGAESLMIPLRGYPAGATRRQQGADGSVFQPGSGIRTSACRHRQSAARPVERAADRASARGAPHRPLLPAAVRPAAARAAVRRRPPRSSTTAAATRAWPWPRSASSRTRAALVEAIIDAFTRQMEALWTPGTSSAAATPRPTAWCAPSSSSATTCPSTCGTGCSRSRAATRPGCASPAPAPTSRPTSTTSAS